jgi:hypothetical protein
MPHKFSSPLIPILCVFFALLEPGARADATEPPRFDDEAQTTWRQVTWDDFKARWRKLSRFGAEAAYIASGIQITDWHAVPERQPDGTYTARPEGLTAFAFMEKFESSVLPGKNTDYALAHEQGHFDLTETVARELRAELTALEGRGPTADTAALDLKDQVDTAFAGALQRLDRVQASYDGETRHGTRKRVQRRWLREIEERLTAAQHKLDSARAAR